MTRVSVCFVSAAFLFIAAVGPANADWSIDIESGIAYSGYNDVRIPGNTGTDISLSEDLEADPAEFVRLRLAIDLGDRHQISFLVAPLRFESAGAVDRAVDFNGVGFDANVPLKSVYRFDSYRLTYRYRWLSKERYKAGIGFTGKVRDAAISISNDGVSSEKTNTGFVPLINFAFDWRFVPRAGLILEGDALAAPQGRAEDVVIGVYGEPWNQVRLRLGYRILEGGADNDEVYTFALVHYVSAGLTWTF